mmetsp:Transcript_117892/g.338069  ORF Transcript_117892/g.338069 Transcript_117892/m.338069 type:complete len:293 (+) Transcript_117892:265-1143(+)
MRDVHVSCLQDERGAVNVDRQEDLLLTKPLQSLDAELVCGDKQVHRYVQVDLYLIGVKILEKSEEHTMGDLRNGDRFLLRLAHLPFEHGPEVRASHAQELVRVDRLALHDEGDVRQLLLVEKAAEIGHQRAAGDVDVDLGRQLELPKVVQPLLPIVATEHEQRIVVHVASVAESRTWHARLLPGTRHWPNFVPLVGFKAEGVQIVPGAAGAPSEEVHGVAANHRRVRVPRRRRRHLPGRLDEAPLEGVEVELIEVVQVLGTVVTADYEHLALVRHGRRAVPGLGDGSFHRHD